MKIWMMLLFLSSPLVALEEEFLRAEMERHLRAIESSCDGPDKQRHGKTNVRAFYNFVREVAQTPRVETTRMYVDAKMGEQGDVSAKIESDTRISIMLGNMTHVLQGGIESNTLSARSFRFIYMSAFHLPERTQVSEYPHSWASRFEKGLRCIEK